MDSAYDHIQEQTYRKDNEDSINSGADKETKDQQPTLNAEFQDAYRAFSASPWGARIGGFLGNVVKQARLPRNRSEISLANPVARASLSTARPKRSSPLSVRMRRVA